MRQERLCPDRSSPPGHNREKSEGDSPGKLNHARQVVLPAHLAYSAAPAGRRIELRSVEQVEEFTPELEAKAFSRSKLRVLEGSEIKVLLSVGANVGLGTRIGPITVVIGGAGSEYGSVVPLQDFLGSGARSQVRQGGPGRPGAANVGNTGVAQRSRAALDVNRVAALEGDDRINAPPADQLVGRSIYAIGILFAVPKWQIQNAADDKPLRDIEAIQAALAAEVICVGVSPARG